MPICIVRVIDRVYSLRIRRIFDIEQDPVTGAGAGCESELWIRRNIVTLIGFGGSSGSVSRRTFQSIDSAGRWIPENSRCGHDLGILERSQRHFDHIDAKPSAIYISVRRAIRAACELFALTDK